MSNIQNGQLVLNAMNKIKKPTTPEKVAEIVASEMNATSSKCLCGVIKQTMDAGVQIGYLVKNKRLYEIAVSDQYIEILLNGNKC